MKKISLLALTAAVVISSLSAPAEASSTSDKGMGLFEYPWFIDGLHSYIYENPAHLPNFKNRVFAERVGVTDGQNMGGLIDKPLTNLTYSIHFGYPVNTSVWNTNAVDSLFHKDTYSVKSKSKFTYGLPADPTPFGGYQSMMLNESIIDITDAAYGSALKAGDVSMPRLREPLTQRNFSAMLAYNFSRFTLGVDFGYATSWARDRSSDTTANIKEEYNLINTEYSSKIGAAVPINQKVSLDFVIDGKMYLLNNDYARSEPGYETDMSYKSKMAMDIGSSLRVNYQMSENHKMHFRLAYAYLNRSTEGQMRVVDTAVALPAYDVNGTDSFSRIGHQIDVGISDEFPMAKNLRAFFGFNTQVKLFKNEYSGTDKILAGNNPDKYSNNYTAVTVPLIVGMEGNLTENWMGRFGLVQTVYAPITYEGKNITNSISGTPRELPTSANLNSSPTTAFNLGLSYKHGNFTFDWLGNVELFSVGPYIVSGKGSSSSPNQMATAFAVTYNYDIRDAADAEAEMKPDAKDAKKPVPAKR